MRRNSPETFWSRVDTSAGPDACHPWTGRRKPVTGGQSAGHGVYDHDSTWDYTHRYAWYLTHGRWPEPACLHHCDNPPCCNVRHLYEGTQQDNVRDRDQRHRRQARRGETSTASKLTRFQVEAIRTAFTGQRGQQSALARQYGVSVSTIHLIVHGRTWQ